METGERERRWTIEPAEAPAPTPEPEREEAPTVEREPELVPA